MVVRVVLKASLCPQEFQTSMEIMEQGVQLMEVYGDGFLASVRGIYWFYIRVAIIQRMVLDLISIFGYFWRFKVQILMGGNKQSSPSGFFVAFFIVLEFQKILIISRSTFSQIRTSGFHTNKIMELKWCMWVGEQYGLQNVWI